MNKSMAGDPCGCGESVGESASADISLDELEGALAAVESDSAFDELDLGAGGLLDVDESFDLLDDLSLPTAGAGVTLEALLALVEEHPGLKISIGY